MNILHTILSGQMPSLPAGSIEAWLLPAFAVGSIALMAMKLFVRRPPLEAQFVSKEEFGAWRVTVERDLSGLRDRIDSRHLSVIEALEKLRADLLADAERRSGGTLTRLGKLEAGLARLDERTRE